MKTKLIASLVAALFGAAALLHAEDKKPKMPEMPAPAKEHAWLQKFVGQWDTEVEITMEPGKPPMKAKGKQTARMLGGFWLVEEGIGTMDGMADIMTNVLQLGYDPQKKKYVGTWIDSMAGHLWVYEGTVDAAGKILTLNTEGPCPAKPGITKFKETVEFDGDDHRIFTSSMLGDDGKWTKMVTAHYRRRK